jgi:hypothetical protein
MADGYCIVILLLNEKVAARQIVDVRAADDLAVIVVDTAAPRPLAVKKFGDPEEMRRV